MPYQEKHLPNGKTAVIIDEDSLHHIIYNSVRAFRFKNGKGPDAIIIRKLKCTSDIADGRVIMIQYEDETISNDEYWKSVGIKPGGIKKLVEEAKLKEKKTDVSGRLQRAKQNRKANEAVDSSAGDSSKPDADE